MRFKNHILVVNYCSNSTSLMMSFKIAEKFEFYFIKARVLKVLNCKKVLFCLFTKHIAKNLIEGLLQYILPVLYTKAISI